MTVVGNLLLYRLDLANINNVTLAHIHGPASTTANAPVRVDFYAPPAGTTGLNFTTSRTLASGVAPPPSGITADSLLVILRNGNTYVNVHTNDLNSATTTPVPGDI